MGGRMIVRPDYRVKVLYSWDGNMKYPSTEGLPLVAESEFWLYCPRNYRPSAQAVITELDWISNSGNDWMPTIRWGKRTYANITKRQEKVLKVAKEIDEMLNEWYGSESSSVEGGDVEDEDKVKDKGEPDDQFEPHTYAEHSPMDTPGPGPKLPLFSYPKPSVTIFLFPFRRRRQKFRDSDAGDRRVSLSG
ncbi:hypothetical protein D9758_008615 [Tetrapyrgos nigripes]|uniref:Uncharacterized protein n=1 Tax=Tetrapyrgos nigripes TaxID=182062 RepID=A0A8H5FYS9_9AGAR|nr:hypothetical protein D9758_008615 [Tetrapyrgos nigripes]